MKRLTYDLQATAYPSHSVTIFVQDSVFKMFNLKINDDMNNNIMSKLLKGYSMLWL